MCKGRLLRLLESSRTMRLDRPSAKKLAGCPLNPSFRKNLWYDLDKGVDDVNPSLSTEQKKYMIDRIQEYFELERMEPLGELAADQLLHFMVEELGPFMYNKGVHDARQMVDQKVMNLDEDLLSLERPAGRPRR